jgi:hypothetical protein
MNGPWTASEVQQARNVPLLQVLHHVCEYVKEDRGYKPHAAASGSRRFHVNCSKRDFRLILTGERWVDELVGRNATSRGGGGAIDLVMHLQRFDFVQAVKVCLEARGD